MPRDVRLFFRSFRRMAAKDRTRAADRQLGTILAFIAGAINAIGFISVGIYTSHMTGIVSSISNAFILRQGSVIFTLAGFLFCFIAGAITSSVIVNFATSRRYQSEFALPLMLEAVLLMLFSLAAVGFFTESDIKEEIIELLSFIMGLQNALITKMSQRAIRTTHITGIATDIGVEIGRYIARQFNKSIPYEPYRLRLNGQLLIAFIIGGLGGAQSFYAIGFGTTIILSLLLIVIAIAPIWRDITTEDPKDIGEMLQG